MIAGNSGDSNDGDGEESGEASELHFDGWGVSGN